MFPNFLFYVLQNVKKKKSKMLRAQVETSVDYDGTTKKRKLIVQNASRTQALTLRGLSNPGVQQRKKGGVLKVQTPRRSSADAGTKSKKKNKKKKSKT